MKRVPKWLSEIIDVVIIQQEAHEEEELFVCLVVLEWDDGDSIAQLQAKTVNGIIHQNHVFHRHILDHSQILNVNVIRCFDAAVSIQSILEELVIGVDVVQDNICVPLVRGCEDNHLVVLVNFYQHLSGMRPNVETCAQNFTRLSFDV